MHFIFTGDQSGHWTALCSSLLRARTRVSVAVDGKRPLDDKPVAGLDGVVVSARWDGYIRNIAIRTNDDHSFTLRCTHATDEDIAVIELHLVFDAPTTGTLGHPESALNSLSGDNLFYCLLHHIELSEKDTFDALLTHIETVENEERDRLWPAVLAGRLLIQDIH